TIAFLFQSLPRHGTVSGERTIVTNSRLHRWILLLGTAAVAALPALGAPARPNRFLEKYCLECHDAEAKKGGLDLGNLKWDLSNPDTFAEWLRVNDRVAAGEMPPKRKPRPAPGDLATFTNVLSSALLTADRAKVALEGRATKRR